MKYKREASVQLSAEADFFFCRVFQKLNLQLVQNLQLKRIIGN